VKCFGIYLSFSEEYHEVPDMHADWDYKNSHGTCRGGMARLWQERATADHTTYVHT